MLGALLLFLSFPTKKKKKKNVKSVVLMSSVRVTWFAGQPPGPSCYEDGTLVVIPCSAYHLLFCTSVALHICVVCLFTYLSCVLHLEYGFLACVSSTCLCLAHPWITCISFSGCPFLLRELRSSVRGEVLYNAALRTLVTTGCLKLYA